MKTVKYFKTGEAIPTDAKYLNSTTKIVGYETSADGEEEHPVLEDFHLYEVTIETGGQKWPQK